MSTNTMTVLEVFLGLGGVLLAILNTWVLFAVRAFKDDIIALRNEDKALADRAIVQSSELREKIGAIQLLVAGNYVTKDEFRAGLSEQTRILSQKIDDFAKMVTPYRRSTDKPLD